MKAEEGGLGQSTDEEVTRYRERKKENQRAYRARIREQSPESQDLDPATGEVIDNEDEGLSQARESGDVTVSVTGHVGNGRGEGSLDLDTSGSGGEAVGWNVTPIPDGDGWTTLPDGSIIESSALREVS